MTATRADSDPRPLSLVVTDRRKVNPAEIALRASEAQFRALFEQSGIPMTTQRGGIILDANRAVLGLLRCDDPTELIGRPGIERIAPHALPALAILAESDPEGLRPATFETVGVRFDGTEFPVLVQVTPIELPDGLASVGVYTDLTDQRQVETERTQLVEDLRRSQHHLGEAQRIGHIGSWEQDIETKTVWLSDESCRIFGIEPGTFVGSLEGLLAFVHPDDRAMLAPSPDIPAKAQAPDTVYRILRPDGTIRVVHEVGEVMLDPAGVPVRFVGTIQDITERVAAEAERTRLALAVEQTADSIWMHDLAGNVIYVNRSFTRIYGYEADEIVGRYAGMIDSGEHAPDVFASIWAIAASGQAWTGSLINRRKDGTLFEVEAVISGMYDPAGRLVGYMQTDRDVTRERALESALERDARERQSIESALTRIDSAGTPEEIAGAACAEIVALSNVESAYVIILDADEGHILASAGRSSDHFPAGSPVAQSRHGYLRERAGGGPWVQAWKALPGDAEDVVTRTGIHSNAYAPFACAGDTIGLIVVAAYDPVTAALLVERLPALVTFGSIVGTLIRPGLTLRQRETADRSALQAVIDASAFRPFFQPIVDLWDGSVVGHEALTRFSDGRAPNVVFAAAVRAGLGIELEIACLGASLEASENLPAETFLSINVSPELVLSGSLGTLLESVSRSVVIEITEHVAIDDYEGLRRELKRLGNSVRLAVDDAGAGYASFRHILELAPDFVKIDIALVRGVDAEPARQALIAGMGYFASKRRLHLVAEGIETVKEIEALQALAVRYGQGYLLGRPQDGLVPGSWPTRVDLPAFSRT